MTTWKDGTPIYLQLKELIVGLILDGTLVPGQDAPSVRQIAADYQLNPLTVQRAMQELIAEGILEKRRGLGSVVAADAHRRLKRSQKQRFVTEEWPAIVQRARALGIDLQELVSREGHHEQP